MRRSTADTSELLTAAMILLAEAAPTIEDNGITLIGVAVSNLDDTGAEQFELPFGGGPDTAALDTAMDSVRKKFGSGALTRGALLGRDPDIAVPTAAGSVRASAEWGRLMWVNVVVASIN